MHIIIKRTPCAEQIDNIKERNVYIMLMNWPKNNVVKTVVECGLCAR